jgi:hypothetical protein
VDAPCPKSLPGISHGGEGERQDQSLPIVQQVYWCWGRQNRKWALRWMCWILCSTALKTHLGIFRESSGAIWDERIIWICGTERG